ncbi:MAG: FecR domain-containing protein [Tannerella sp.]|jgi:ferric-dicitrate binding protein FerR (iron transport regulator)|nr:FecR domain-containing protein [Tannerella sp.]
MKQIPAHIESIMIALFSGEAAGSEVNILREWLDASPEHHEWMETYRRTCLLLKAGRPNSRYDADRAWKQVTSALKKKPSRPAAFRWMKLPYRHAAVFILAFAAGVGAMRLYYPAQEAEQTAGERETFFTEYTVPYGSKSRVILPDSSLIWMNAGSKLRYSQAFNRTDREVFIEGEAYFKVARNEAKPFFVKTSAVTLKVLGTSFNVKAYPEEEQVETTVESGSVQVLRNVAGQLMDKLILTAGEKVTVMKAAQADSLTPVRPLPPREQPEARAVMPEKPAGKTVVTQNVTTELYTSWKDTRWLIRKEMLESLAVKLERRYNVRISFADESLKHFSFSGTLLDETLEQVLEAIKLSAPVNYAINKNTVKLSRNRWIAADDHTN